MYGFVFSFLFFGWCTAQDEGSWWQKLNKIDPSVAGIFDKEKLDYAEQGCEEIKLKYKNDPADIRLKKYFKEYFDIDFQTLNQGNETDIKKLIKGIVKADYSDCLSEETYLEAKCHWFGMLLPSSIESFFRFVLRSLA